MPNVKGRVRKGKTKSKVDDEEKVPEEVEAGMEMAEPDGAEDIEGAGGGPRRDVALSPLMGRVSRTSSLEIAYN